MPIRPQAPHPLAVRLVAAASAEGELLDLGTGSGRNLRLLAVSHRATGVDDDADRVRRLREQLRADGCGAAVVHASYTQLPFGRARFAGAISTHALLHGTRPKVRLAIAEAARVLREGAPFFLALASVDDARYGEGTMLEADVFAPATGDEVGVPHLYVDDRGVPDLLCPFFAVESQRDVDADPVVGRWAHGDAPPRGRRHWLVEARRR